MSGPVFGLVFLCFIGFAASLDNPSGCPDLIIRHYDDKDTAKLHIDYYIGPRYEALIYCQNENRGDIELVSDKGSLGLVGLDSLGFVVPHVLYCNLGRWYSYNRRHERVKNVKEIACVLHLW